MKASIIFLGTGGDSFVVGRGQRSSAGFILQVGDNQFHVDPGNGATQAARAAEVNVRATTAVFATRNTIHHASGLNSLLDAMTYGGFDKKGVLVAHSDVINGKDDSQPFLHNSCRDLLERYISLQPGKRVGINEVEIQALKTTFASSIGLKFFLPTLTIAYAGDTKYAADVVEQYRDAGILILNVPYLKKDRSNDGLSLEEAQEIALRIRPKLTIITSIGAEMQNQDPIYAVREIQRAVGTQVIAANDGLVINPVSYAADAGQWTLQGYKRSAEQEVDAPQIKEEPAEQTAQKQPEKNKSEDNHSHGEHDEDKGFLFTEVVGGKTESKEAHKEKGPGPEQQKKLDDVDEIDELIGSSEKSSQENKKDN